MLRAFLTNQERCRSVRPRGHAMSPMGTQAGHRPRTAPQAVLPSCSPPAVLPTTTSPLLPSPPQIKFADADLCLEVEGGSRSLAAPFQVGAGCTGGDHQLWTFEVYGAVYRLRAKHSNMCMDVEAGHQHNWAKLQQWACYDMAQMTVKLAAGEFEVKRRRGGGGSC